MDYSNLTTAERVRTFQAPAELPASSDLYSVSNAVAIASRSIIRYLARLRMDDASKFSLSLGWLCDPSKMITSVVLSLVRGGELQVLKPSRLSRLFRPKLARLS